jgi:hypothetical protein
MRKKTFTRGERVAWNTSQGETTGKVVERLTDVADIKGHHVATSDDDPQYLVESARARPTSPRPCADAAADRPQPQ